MTQAKNSENSENVKSTDKDLIDTIPSIKLFLSKIM
jgi:hypothetical protein